MPGSSAGVVRPSDGGISEWPISQLPASIKHLRIAFLLEP